MEESLRLVECMSKKKTNRKKSGNRTENRPPARIRELRCIYDEGNKAIANGGAPADPWLFVAAAHALDLYDVAADSKQGFRLNLTTNTQDSVLPAAMISLLMLRTQGKTELEARQTLAKRIAAYMMFQVYNDLDAAGYDVAFECQSSFVLSARWGESETYRFDFLGRAMLAMRRFIIGDQDYEFIAGGSLHPFDHKLWVEFMKPLTESAGVSAEDVGES